MAPSSHAPEKAPIDSDASPSSPSYTPLTPAKRRHESATYEMSPEWVYRVRLAVQPAEWSWYPDLVRTLIHQERVPHLPATGLPSSFPTLPPLHDHLERVVAAMISKADREFRRA